MTKQTEKTEDKPTVKEAPKKVEPKKRKEATIYVGPTLRGGKLARYTVFKGGEYLPNVAQLIDSNKAIKSLIVPVSRLAEVESRLRDPSSLESLRYKEAEKIKGDQ